MRTGSTVCASIATNVPPPPLYILRKDHKEVLPQGKRIKDQQDDLHVCSIETAIFSEIIIYSVKINYGLVTFGVYFGILKPKHALLQQIVFIFECPIPQSSFVTGKLSLV